MKNPISLQIQIRRLLILFIVFLIISGVTAFWLTAELKFLIDNFSFGNYINIWLIKVYGALSEVDGNHPFLIYGYDWLAFGHLIIALFFLGPLKKPIENKWVIKYGMIACLAIFPTAFIAGYARGIPWLWQLVDCSFGIFGFLLLWIIYRKVEQLKKQLEFNY